MLSTQTDNNKMANNKKPYQKKSNNKKRSPPTTHPYLESIQEEITALEQKLNTIEDYEKNNELSSEEQTEKTVTKACLERYKETMTKLTDSAMESKYRSYTDSQLNRTKENVQKQVLDLLAFFYIIRLGQCGLFDQINSVYPLANNTMLNTITDLSDQLVGAAVYYQKENHQIQKKQQIFDLLKKLDRGDDEAINNDKGDTTFKQVKELMQHVWKQLKTPQEIVHTNNGVYAVLQFDGMIPSSTAATVGSNDEAEDVEAEGNATVDQPNSTTEEIAISIQPVEEENVASKGEEEIRKDSWDDKPKEKKNKDSSYWENKSKQQSSSWNDAAPEKEEEKGSWGDSNKPKESEVEGESSGWDSKPEEKKEKEHPWNKNDSWDNVDESLTSSTLQKKNDADKNGWTKSYDLELKADNWDNAGSPNIPESNTTAKASTEKTINAEQESPVVEPSAAEEGEGGDTNRKYSTNDDWRRRRSTSNEHHEIGRGRGRGRGHYSSRGRGNGEHRGRGRARGFSTHSERAGRGRGIGSRGRGRDSPTDYNRSSQ